MRRASTPARAPLASGPETGTAPCSNSSPQPPLHRTAEEILRDRRPTDPSSALAPLSARLFASPTRATPALEGLAERAAPHGCRQRLGGPPGYGHVRGLGPPAAPDRPGPPPIRSPLAAPDALRNVQGRTSPTTATDTRRIPRLCRPPTSESAGGRRGTLPHAVRQLHHPTRPRDGRTRNPQSKARDSSGGWPPSPDADTFRLTAFAPISVGGDRAAFNVTPSPIDRRGRPICPVPGSTTAACRRSPHTTPYSRHSMSMPRDGSNQHHPDDPSSRMRRLPSFRRKGLSTRW